MVTIGIVAVVLLILYCCCKRQRRQRDHYTRPDRPDKPDRPIIKRDSKKCKRKRKAKKGEQQSRVEFTAIDTADTEEADTDRTTASRWSSASEVWQEACKKVKKAKIVLTRSTQNLAQKLSGSKEHLNHFMSKDPSQPNLQTPLTAPLPRRELTAGIHRPSAPSAQPNDYGDRQADLEMRRLSTFVPVKGPILPPGHSAPDRGLSAASTIGGLQAPDKVMQPYCETGKMKYPNLHQEESWESNLPPPPPRL